MRARQKRRDAIKPLIFRVTELPCPSNALVRSVRGGGAGDDGGMAPARFLRAAWLDAAASISGVAVGARHRAAPVARRRRRVSWRA